MDGVLVAVGSHNLILRQFPGNAEIFFWQKGPKIFILFFFIWPKDLGRFFLAYSEALYMVLISTSIL
jgi:hypothetical protein